MSHRCDAACLRLKNLLQQGSSNGVWENVFRDYDPLLVEAAEVCPDVEVVSVGNKRRFLLRKTNPPPDDASLGAAAALPTPKTPSRPNTAFSFSNAWNRVEVSWFEQNANVFFVQLNFQYRISVTFYQSDFLQNLSDGNRRSDLPLYHFLELHRVCLLCDSRSVLGGN